MAAKRRIEKGRQAIVFYIIVRVQTKKGPSGADSFSPRLNFTRQNEVSFRWSILVCSF